MFPDLGKVMLFVGDILCFSGHRAKLLEGQPPMWIV